MLDQSLSLTGLFASAFISSTIAPGGSEAVLAYMVNQSFAPVQLLVLVATVGNTLGAMTTWYLGVWLSRKYPAENHLDEGKQKSLQHVRKWGIWVLLLSWLPIVGDGFCFAGGWLRLTLIPSILAIALGKAVRYIAIAYTFI